MNKKIFVALVLLLLLSSLAGCKVNQEGTTPNVTSPSSPSSQKPIKLVHIDSDPEGATVYIDKSDVLITPGYAQIQAGQHTIQFSMDTKIRCSTA